MGSFDVPTRATYTIQLETSSMSPHKSQYSQSRRLNDNTTVDPPVGDMTGALLIKMAMCHICCEHYQFSTNELHIGEADLAKYKNWIY